MYHTDWSPASNETPGKIGPAQGKTDTATCGHTDRKQTPAPLLPIAAAAAAAAAEWRIAIQHRPCAR